ncbi:TIGR01777 family oxidoreductase [Pseudokineococcus marinus]|uniref:TIGR01777 family protein n=1 Tax=Pseudokineococcus marinus TaxID=351215 RepID=A0A849BPL1_9ACTN|nr:TIGR01777 family oxidoreductase [Pseudokineococcus marinus]NNH23395.1 TIGR01777 family protein [Pseudokineococcus marinus]
MKVVVCGASGLIGTALRERLVERGHQVVQLVRREPSGPDQVRWDPARRRLDAGALEGVEAAVNLSGAGVGDQRWTPAYQREVLASRTEPTRTLAEALARLEPRPRVLVQGSAIGVYGHRGEEVLTESSAPGSTFLADVVLDWEAAARPAQDAGIRTAFARTGLVMAPGAGAFGKLLPLLRLGLGGPLGDGRQWWSWITLEDEVSALVHLLETDVEGPVDLTGPAPVRNAELTRALGRAFGRPTLLPVPRLALRAVVGGFADEILASQRVLPTVLQRSGFRFAHEDVDAAARWLADAA